MLQIALVKICAKVLQNIALQQRQANELIIHSSFSNL